MEAALRSGAALQSKLGKSLAMNDQKSAEAIGQQLASIVSPETMPHLKVHCTSCLPTISPS